MGINATILEWFGFLYECGALKGLESVLELGPQDLFFPADVLHSEVMKRIGSDGEAVFRGILNHDATHSDRQALFYSMYGIFNYASVDSYDNRATYQQDLNIAVVAPSKFDLIVDCGTNEHVFNVANVFVYTHNSLADGGVVLKVLPTFGDNTHGFYNIHPTVYFDVARVNGYEIIDFRYVDDMISRDSSRGAASLFDRRELELRLHSFAGCASIQEEVSRNFLRILEKQAQAGQLANAHNAVDYCFVAMRKVRSEPFRYPGQGVYLTEFAGTS